MDFGVVLENSCIDDAVEPHLAVVLRLALQQPLCRVRIGGAFCQVVLPRRRGDLVNEADRGDEHVALTRPDPVEDILADAEALGQQGGGRPAVAGLDELFGDFGDVFVLVQG